LDSSRQHRETTCKYNNILFANNVCVAAGARSLWPVRTGSGRPAASSLVANCIASLGGELCREQRAGERGALFARPDLPSLASQGTTNMQNKVAAILWSRAYAASSGAFGVGTASNRWPHSHVRSHKLCVAASIRACKKDWTPRTAAAATLLAKVPATGVRPRRRALFAYARPCFTGGAESASA